MYSPLQLSFKYLLYYFRAENARGHGIHSPFVFHLITKVFRDQQQYPEYKIVEQLRKELSLDQTQLPVQDLGAGSAATRSNHRSVASLAKIAAKPPKYARLISRMARYYQPRSILELGTSLGITTCYLSLACPGSEIITLEGVPSIAAAAKKNFRRLGLENINLMEGNFDHTLPVLMERKSPVDFVFLDGNHRAEPTIRYFKTLLPSIHPGSVIIFDDIHWSAEMEEAWKMIKNHVSVKCSVDLFFVGILFFREEFKEKLDFTIRF